MAYFRKIIIWKEIRNFKNHHKNNMESFKKALAEEAFLEKENFEVTRIFNKMPFVYPYLVEL